MKALRSEVGILRLIHENNKISCIEFAKGTVSSAASTTAVAHEVIIFGERSLSRRRNCFLRSRNVRCGKRNLEKAANEVELKVSTLGREAGALGAARLISETALDRLYAEH